MTEERYKSILSALEGYRQELLVDHDKLADNPVKAGEYQGKIRLGVSDLITYMNEAIDRQIEASEEYAREKSRIYQAQLKEGKTPSAAEKHATEMTRELNATVLTAKLRVDQIKNEYEKYSNIAIYLASRAKEFISERYMG